MFGPWNGRRFLTILGCVRPAPHLLVDYITGPRRSKQVEAEVYFLRSSVF